MADNIFYISAGLVPIDNSSGATADTDYISAGLVPNDTAASSAEEIEPTDISVDTSIASATFDIIHSLPFTTISSLSALTTTVVSIVAAAEELGFTDVASLSAITSSVLAAVHPINLTNLSADSSIANLVVQA